MLADVAFDIIPHTECEHVLLYCRQLMLSKPRRVVKVWHGVVDRRVFLLTVTDLPSVTESKSEDFREVVEFTRSLCVCVCVPVNMCQKKPTEHELCSGQYANMQLTNPL